MADDAPVSAFVRNRSDLVPVLTTLLVGSLLVVAARAAWPADACGPDEVKAQMTPQQGSAAIQLVVLSSSNKSGVMAEMACRFEHSSSATIDGRPIDVVITSEASGSAYQTIGENQFPTVWSPASTSWVSMLRHDHEKWVPGETPSIAQSPQVIAMPSPIAQALGWPDSPLGWSDIARFATDRGAWDAVSDPSWGAFKLGRTNPRLSTSGLNSTVANFMLATDFTSDLTTQEVEDPAVQARVHGVESATVHYAPTSVDFLRNLRTQDEQGNGEGYVSAIVLEEKSVWDYNHGNPSGDPTTLGDNPAPATPLRAFYPEEGALVADHPYVVLDAPWVDADERVAAGRFKDFLLAPAQQERFQSLGFRDHAGVAGSQISKDNGLLPLQPTSTLPAPDGVVLQAIREAWPSYRKQARMLIVIDVSASMGNAAATGSDVTKLQLAEAAARNAITQLGPHDEVGLWTFSPASGEPYVENVPIDTVSANRAKMQRAIRGLTADGDNRGELYDTVDAAVASLRAGFDGKKINGMVLLSDGPDEGSTIDRTHILTAVQPPPGTDREVRIFTIAYGDGADTETLAGLANASRGTAYDATNPADVGKVFYEVVANF